mmetsp:Transcript_99948/g.279986  ORF Transcript_99948/g.279986 Transcript_99948/m.279986 type:complete len:250 (+) Transcript_99948:2135-2884(+)
MIIMEPYRNPFNSSSYCWLRSRPTILMMFWISSLAIICFSVASRTLSNLPRRGKTPYLSRPMTLSPATASALAESPSVRIKVHAAEPLPPASLASSSFGTPRTRCWFFVPPFNWRPRSTFCFALAQSRIISTMPLFRTLRMVFSEISHEDPNLDCFVVKVSLVCESKAGFSIKQFTKTHKWFFTCCGLISMPPRFLVFTTFRMASTSWSVTWLTCVPPLTVQIEFTWLTWLKPLSLVLTATSQRSPHRS